jgi:hypothetical protein
MRKLFNHEEVRVPQGLTDEDVNLKKNKRLFSNIFYLRYIKHMASWGLAGYGRMLPNFYRGDIRSFISKALTGSIELENEASELLLVKGLAIRPPFIPYPQKVEFVHKQSFFLEGLGRRDSLSGTEVTHLNFNI